MKNTGKNMLNIALIFAGGIVLYYAIKKFGKKEEEEEQVPVIDEPTEIDEEPAMNFAGTSDIILNKMDERQAEELKDELK